MDSTSMAGLMADLKRFARKLRVREEWIEDLVQETMVAVLRHQPREARAYAFSALRRRHAQLHRDAAHQARAVCLLSRSTAKHLDGRELMGTDETLLPLWIDAAVTHLVDRRNHQCSEIHVLSSEALRWADVAECAIVELLAAIEDVKASERHRRRIRAAVAERVADALPLVHVRVVETIDTDRDPCLRRTIHTKSSELVVRDRFRRWFALFVR